MELFGNEKPDKEPTAEELDELLDESFSLMSKILIEHKHDEHPHSVTLPATTTEAGENNKFGSLTVIDHGENLEVKIDETSIYPELKDNTTERYSLSFSYDVGDYILTTSGTQPNVAENELMDDGDDNDYSQAINAAEEYISEQTHPATPDEIKRLAYLLEIAAFGNVQAHFENFEIRREHDYDVYDMRKRNEIERQENENHPE